MNPVVHFEMSYADRERVALFYQKTFNWNMEMLGPEMGEYVVAHTSETNAKGMIQKPGMINGGFYKKQPKEEFNVPSVVIAVDSVEDTITKIEKNGGKVVNQPMDIPGIGRYASFIDTEGNRASILKPIETM